MNFLLDQHFQPHVRGLPVWRKQPKGSSLNLSSNEFVHPAVDAVARDVLASLATRTVTAYPFHGTLVDRLADVVGVPSEHLMVAAGSDDAIKIIADGLFRSTGRLVLQEPNYELVRQYAALRGVDVVGVPPGPDRDSQMADLDAALAGRAPASVYVANPNGPLGTCFSLAEMATLADRCRAGGHLLFVDEAYVPYNGFDHTSLVRGRDNVVLVRSFSKSYGIAGARLAVVAAEPAVIDYLRPWQSANPVSGMTAAIMAAFLDRADEIAVARQEIIDTRRWFADEVVAAIPAWRALPAHANFVNFVVDTDPRELAARMLTRRIRVKSMDGLPGLAGCLRLTIADRARMETVLAALVACQAG